ncbi:hypothetical protein PISMIDRAFT_7805 [Pisolithus microcarpus 441]|uniref:Uncharacterized protein n=1 Tax=Pisolithus microcarpus 441 TaxID=765257 RepID=A0A0C9YS05_9AGAM|nr:hypothetical protein BKA83DRAFT_7805 [Pisolithus microcarpus]KIK27800.1 hypothetical protein PISMIDRAFT_7805 [Pisolithus microcarpus 441]
MLITDTFSPREYGLPTAGVGVIMKSDTPAAVVSHWLLHDAQQAYYYGLPVNAAITSVMTTAANLLGLDY